MTGGSCAGAQRRQKSVAVDAMLAASIVDGVKAGDRTADASHLELKKNPDRLRRLAHDIVDQIVRSNGHARLRSGVNGNATVPRGSLSRRKLCGGCPSLNLAPSVLTSSAGRGKFT